MTIETAMWFALGFLTAAILALIVMSSLWRRAERLTRGRVSRELPADVHAAIADKDLQAARFATDHRRLELAMAAARRQAADARIEFARARQAHLDETRRADELETRVADLDAHLTTTKGALDDALTEIEEKRLSLEEEATRISGLLHDVSARDIEVATRKTELGTLEVQIEAARNRSVEQMRRIDDLLAEKGRAETLLVQERDRADRLDKRIERLVADLADREEVAAQRQRELDRAREALAVSHQRVTVLGAREENLPQASAAMLRTLDQLEARNRDLEARLAAAETGADGKRGDKAPAPPSAGREALRNEMAGLAAEMAHLTERLEGPGSPIDRILAATEGSAGPRPSLAERIRRLRETETTSAATADGRRA